MKRFFLNKFIFLNLAALSMLLFFSCKEKNSDSVKNDASVSSAESIPTEKKDIESYTIEDFFKLDYTAQTPEANSIPEKIGTNYTASSEKSEDVIPGLRSLDKYKTSYKKKRLSLSEYLKSIVAKDELAEVASSKKKKSVKPLAVVSWGPQNEIPGEVDKAEFYVEFSSSVKPLEALKDQDKINQACAEIMKIEPSVQGNYTWLGSQMLSFNATEPLDPAQVYTITVNENLVSLDGAKISGNREFKTKSASLEFVELIPGKKSDGTSYRYSGSGIPKEHAKFALVRFNHYLTEKDVSSILKISQNNVLLDYSISGDFEKKNYSTKLSLDGKRATSFFVVINDSIKDDSSVVFSIKEENSGKVFSKSYGTLEPLKLLSSKEYKWGSGGGWEFRFNNEIDKNTVLSSISSSSIKITERNIDCWGSTLIVTRLFITPQKTESFTLGGDVSDIYGSKLGKDVTVSLTGQDLNGYARFIDSGNKILESQFPYKLVFEYLNARDGGYYTVGKTDDPLDSRVKGKEFGTSYEIKESKKNERIFKEIDLEPYLDNGKGFVHFETSFETTYTDYNGRLDWYLQSNSLNVQVTDLAATARIGANKAVIMVRSLSTGKAVSGAEVSIRNRSSKTSSDVVKTDSKGMAIIPIDPFAYFNYYQSTYDTYVNVKTSDDEVRFVPSTHNAWICGIYPDSITSSFSIKQRTFIFCDRGVYKPGETITFKGIDLNQKFGRFSSYKGEYTVRFEKYEWPEPKSYASVRGETTASGGFDGSFEIPSNLEPGSYRLNYIRDGSKENSTLYFDVAYFEPLKIQAETKITSKEVLAGDRISADFKASYLAGGSLAGAEYKATWYKEGETFSPRGNEFKDYSFGISDPYDSRNVVSSESGTLSSSGTTQLSCSTAGNLKPIPYTYRLETYVTDKSNQRISSVATKLVHPSDFYLGLGKPLNVSGFVKKGETVEIPYILVSPDEKILKDSDLPKNLFSSSFSYELKRSYWSYDYQKSVDGGVYAKYNKHEDVELKNTAKFSSSGKIKISPKEAGYYSLRVECKDSKGRAVVTDYSFYATGSGAVWGGDETSINLTADASMYNPGETAHILMESPLPEGDYLITVEREGIYSEEIRHFDEPCSVLDVKIARNFVPVVYVSVSTYTKRHGEPKHEYGEVDLDKPKGIFGVTELFVNPRVKAFSVKVDTDKKIYRPGDTATVTLTATKDGKPLEGAELTAFAADRAVLDLIDYHVPDPIEFFYSKGNFPLYCYGGDSRDYLMDPVTYSIKNLQGGDADESKDSMDERKEFKPTAFFEPTLITGADGKVSFTFKVPDNLTTFRITAFGIKGELLALQESEFGTQNPINVQAVQPRRLRVRDTAECGVALTNLDSQAHEVTVSVEIRDPSPNAESETGFGETAGKISIDGKNSYKVKISGGNTSVVYFDVAAEAKGFSELVYTIKSDVLNERLVSKIQVEETYFLEKTSISGATEDSASEKLIIPSFAQDNVGSVEFALDGTQLGLLSEAVKYVFHYPYGCMEQQSSAILPLVIFSDYIDDFGLSSEVSNPEKVLKEYFRKWKKVQLHDGGFPYWPNGKEPDFYVSLRIAHIFALAKENGFKARDIQIDLESLKDYISGNVSYQYSTFLKAYACYIFSLLNDSRLDRLLSVLDSDAKTDLSVASYVGLSWLKKGNASKAEEYYKFIRSYMRPSLRSVDITQPSLYRYGYFTSDIIEKALIMQFFVEKDPSDGMVDRLLYSILLELSREGYWQNTASTAKVLESVRSVIKSRNLEATDFNAKCEIMNKTILEEKFKGLSSKAVAKTENFSSSVLKDLPRDQLIPFDFSKKGKGTLYYTATLSYALPDEVQFARNEGFGVEFKIYDYKTNEEVKPTDGGMVIPLESGKTYRMKVTVSSEKERTYTAIRVPIPSGAEILDSTFVTSGSEAKISSGSGWWSNTSILDNEAQFFLDYFYSGNKEIDFTFRASRRGVYPVTPVFAECMYEPEIFGRTDGYIYTIK